MIEKQITAKIVFCALEELSDEEKKLIQMAKDVSNKAYAPYSRFKVGAAILLDNGVMLSGNNQENAAYPSGLCAERVVLFYASSSYPKAKVAMLALAAQNVNGFTSEPVSPCGSCRQVFLEVENRHSKKIRMLLYGTERITIVNSAKDLLPLSFERYFLGETD